MRYSSTENAESAHRGESQRRWLSRPIRVDLPFMAFWVVLVLSRSGWSTDPSSIEIIRDTWGIPHVFAQTDAGALYGLGYATAEDRGVQMVYSSRVIQGRLAEVIGDVKKGRRDETSVSNDRKMLNFGF